VVGDLVSEHAGTVKSGWDVGWDEQLGVTTAIGEASQVNLSGHTTIDQDDGGWDVRVARAIPGDGLPRAGEPVCLTSGRVHIEGGYSNLSVRQNDKEKEGSNEDEG